MNGHGLGGDGEEYRAEVETRGRITRNRWKDVEWKVGRKGKWIRGWKDARS